MARSLSRARWTVLIGTPSSVTRVVAFVTGSATYPIVRDRGGRRSVGNATLPTPRCRPCHIASIVRGQGEGGWDDVRPWHRVAPGADITCWWYRSGVFRPDDRGPLRFGGTGGFEWFGRHAGAGGDADKILGGVDLFAVHGDVADLQVGVGDAQLHEQAEDPQD